MKKTLTTILGNVLKFFAKLTLSRYNPGIIGVTGNVGKTSAKEMIGLVLGGERRIRASSKNFNNEIGLPLSILGDWDKTGGLFFWLKVFVVSITNLFVKSSSYPEVLVLEYGVDRAGDMRYLLEIARPHIGVFTAVGDVPVHIEFFADVESVAREKSKLISQLPTTGFAILNADDYRVMSSKQATRANVITFGFSEKADMRISGFSNYIDDDAACVSFKLTYGGSFVPVKIDGALGRTPAYASAIAAISGLVFGMNLVKISDSLSRYKTPCGRQKITRGVKRSLVIDDTYNASPLAMREALETLKSLKAKRKVAVLGDMLELGKYTLQAHEEIGRISADVVDILFTVGLRGKIIAEAAEKAGLSRKRIFCFMNIHEAGVQLQQKIQHGDLVLVKGSQGVRMEKIVKEIMAEPSLAKDLLVRQTRQWLRTPGLYD